jgi:hypothetical protein
MVNRRLPMYIPGIDVTLAVLPGRLLVLHNSVAELVCMSALWQLQALGNLSTLTQCGILEASARFCSFAHPALRACSAVEMLLPATSVQIRSHLQLASTRWSSEHVIRGQVIRFCSVRLQSALVPAPDRFTRPIHWINYFRVHPYQ